MANVNYPPPISLKILPEQDMGFESFCRWVSDRESSEEFVISKGVIKRFDRYIYCGKENVRRVRRGRCKCYRCKREWSPYRGTVFEKFRIEPQKFLMVLKMFELEVNTEQVSKEVEISRLSAGKLYNFFQKENI